MKKVNIIIVSASVGFGVMCFIWGLLWMVMAKDLANSVKVLEEEKSRLEEKITGLEWELSQVDQMICIKEEE